jgi:thiamine biosynthesis lipoprotein
MTNKPTSPIGPLAKGVTRRRTLRIVAVAAGLPLGIAALRATAPAGQLFHWRGEVLGGLSEVSLWHTDAALAQRSLVRMRGEIARYERILSLYDPESEISRLNAAGTLARPSPELRTLVDEAQRFSLLSDGAFDISVQPLWRLYEAHFWSHSDVRPEFEERAHEVARDLVDFRRIDSGASRIAFAREGMGITLNSLGQGYITDAIADMLRNDGFESAMVDLGEFRAIGRHPDGRAWRVEIADGAARRGSAEESTERSTASGAPRNVELDDMALAVSGGYGTVFEPTGRFHHIFDPYSGMSANALIDAAVIGPRATTANGLATALCVAGEGRAAAMLAACPGTRAMLTRPDGTRITVTAGGITPAA